MKDNNDKSSSAEWASHPVLLAFFILWIPISWLLYLASTADRQFTWLVISTVIVVIVIIVGVIVTSKNAATALEVSKTLMGVAIVWGASTIIWIFALLYLGFGDSSRNFGQHLSNWDALYFALGIFTTAGTGALSPISEVARILVACQYIVDIIYVLGIITLGISRLSAD